MFASQTKCRTCGFDHDVSPFGICPRQEAPLFDRLTDLELRALDRKLASAVHSTLVEFNTLSDNDQLNLDTYGTTKNAYGDFLYEATWLFGEVSETRRIREVIIDAAAGL